MRPTPTEYGLNGVFWLTEAGTLWYRCFSPKTGQSKLPPEDSGILQKSDSNFLSLLLAPKHTHISLNKNRNKHAG